MTMTIAICFGIMIFCGIAVFAVAAVRVGAKAEKRTNRIFEDEEAKRN